MRNIKGSIKILFFIVVFFGLIIWQQVESVRKAYELKKYSDELNKIEELYSRMILRQKELKSSEKLMSFAIANKFTFPKPEQIIYVKICPKNER